MQESDCLSGSNDQAASWTPDGSIYRRLVESVTDYAIYILDEHGFVRSWNAGARRAKIFSAAEIVGCHFSCFYTDEDRAAGLPDRVLATARRVGIFEGAGWRVRKDGSRFWANVVIESVRDDEGLFLGFAKITKDMTAQRETQLAILESERRFRLLVQGVNDCALYMLDVDGAVTNWNAGAERAKGYLAAEIVGQHFSRFFTTEDQGCADTLMTQADVALYDTKAGGKCGFRVYSTDIKSRTSLRREMQQDLRHAVAHASGFEIHYQPLVNVETGLETGREALLRWTHPVHGTVAPSIFIPLAEEMGLIGKLGQWVLDRACSDASRWSEGVRVAVNVSARQLGSGFAGHVARALDASGLPGARLEVEVTESTLLSDSPGKLEDLHQVRALGVSVALDDFGMGFSSLAHLRAFPFDRIKIDGSFVRDAVIRSDCAAIVAVIVDLGRRLGRQVVAEGIENEEHLMLARRQGCDEAQGYLLGRPAPYVEDCLMDGSPDATAAVMS